MTLFKAAIKIGADTFLYKVYENGFKAIVKVAEEAIENTPVLYVPASIETDFLKQFGNDLSGYLSLNSQGYSETSIKKIWNWLIGTVKPGHA
jgi:hypothetical protein